MATFNYYLRQPKSTKRTPITLFVVAILLNYVALPAQNLPTTEDLVRNAKAINALPGRDSILLNWLDRKAKRVLDSLLDVDVDTLVLYSSYYPGDIFPGPDSCGSQHVSKHAYYFWLKGGVYWFKETYGTCDISLGRWEKQVIQFVVDNYQKLHGELFMEHTSISDRGGKRHYINTIADHEGKYFLYIQVNDNHNILRFNELDIEDKNSLFYDYNRDLVSYKLYKLIERIIDK